MLFLDELPGFGPRYLESLRQPIEDHTVTISRTQRTLTFPASFIPVGAMNPCPCGYYGNERHPCTCSMSAIQRYQQRISGPLMDRIDIHLEVQRVPYQKLTAMDGGESSASIGIATQLRRIEAARLRPQARFAVLDKPGLLANGDMGPAEVQTFCTLDEAGSNLMRAAVKQMDLSARAYHRVLKLARTLADLAGEENVQSQHLAEALQYRPLGVV